MTGRIRLVSKTLVTSPLAILLGARVVSAPQSNSRGEHTAVLAHLLALPVISPSTRIVVPPSPVKENTSTSGTKGGSSADGRSPIMSCPIWTGFALAKSLLGSCSKADPVRGALGPVA